VEYAIEAMENGKDVWLEKPASVDIDGLDRLLDAAVVNQGFLAIGYNRRYSPHARVIREFFESRRGPLKIHYRIVAPPPDADSWLNDAKVGGGRVVGEACHFVDLCNFLVGALTKQVYARPVSHNSVDDTFTALLSYPDGSVATIDFLANADSRIPKEYFEVSADGRTARCENFRRTRLSGTRDFSTFNQDKGQAAAIREIVQAHRDAKASPHSLSEIENVSLATFGILKSMASAMPVTITRAAFESAEIENAENVSVD